MARHARTYESSLDSLIELRRWVHELCRAVWDRPSDAGALDLLVLALHEASTNIVRHAYQGDASRPMHVLVEVDDRTIQVGLFHEGPFFDDDRADPPVFDGTRDGGFGLFLIRRCVDDVRYGTDEQGRNGVLLTKHRPADAPA